MAGAFTGGQGDYVTLFEPVASMLEKEGRGICFSFHWKGKWGNTYTAYFAKRAI